MKLVPLQIYHEIQRGLVKNFTLLVSFHVFTTVKFEHLPRKGYKKQRQISQVQHSSGEKNKDL